MEGFPGGRVSQGRVSQKGEKPIAINIYTRARVSEEGEFPRRERFILLLYIYILRGWVPRRESFPEGEFPRGRVSKEGEFPRRERFIQLYIYTKGGGPRRESFPEG